MKEDLAFFLTSGGHTVKIGLRGEQLCFDDLCLIRQQLQFAIFVLPSTVMLLTLSEA